MDWYFLVWQKYAEFDGRSRRKEYWMFALFNTLALLALALLGAIGLAAYRPYGAILFVPVGVYALAMIIPSLAVTVRRFHDIGKSGWIFLLLIVLGAIPFIGLITNIVQLVFTCMDSDPGTNQYGPNPKGLGEFAPAFAANSGFNPAGMGVPPAPFSGSQSVNFCKSCGTKLVEASTFCSVCGTRV